MSFTLVQPTNTKGKKKGWFTPVPHHQGHFLWLYYYFFLLEASAAPFCFLDKTEAFFLDWDALYILTKHHKRHCKSIINAKVTLKTNAKTKRI